MPLESWLDFSSLVAAIAAVGALAVNILDRADRRRPQPWLKRGQKGGGVYPRFDVVNIGGGNAREIEVTVHTHLTNEHSLSLPSALGEASSFSKFPMLPSHESGPFQVGTDELKKLTKSLQPLLSSTDIRGTLTLEVEQRASFIYFDEGRAQYEQTFALEIKMNGDFNGTILSISGMETRFREPGPQRRIWLGFLKRQ